MTVYVTSYDMTYAAQSIQILDSNGSTVVAEQQITTDEMQAGVYVTFKVQGSFTVQAFRSSGYVLLNGIFFDAVPAADGAQLSGLTVQQDGKNVKVSWSNSGTNPVAVERAVSGSDDWAVLATVANGTNTYTDTTAVIDTTYAYRVRAGAGILPGETTAPVTLTVENRMAEVAGKVTGLGGNWIGKVGAAGYFLPFYTINGAWGTVADGRYPITAGGCSGYSLQPGSSIVNFPAGITATEKDSEINTCNGYWMDSNHFSATTDTRAPQDPRDGGATRIKSYVSGGNYVGYHFESADSAAWHYVTVYATCYDTSAPAETIQILDYKGTAVIAQQQITADELRNGVYVTFKIQGSFTLKAVSTGGYAYLTGIFFDEIPTWETTGFTATRAEGSRTPELTWTNHASITQVVIERKDSVTNTWTRIAVTEPGVTSYIDTGCEVNKTYTYRIAPTNSILFGTYSDEKSVVMPTYGVTELTLDTEEGYTVDVKEDVNVSGTLKDANGNALSGKTITFTLDGYLVEKGFVQAVQGTATTGADGSFTYTLNNLPAGTYTLTASFAVDDEDLLAQSADDALITIEVPGWSGAPVLTTVSDGVAPGEYFSINGYGMSGDQVIAKIGAVGSAVANATTLTIAQHDATDGYFVQALMPTGMAGTYQVWVSNDNGTTWSEPILLNAARPLFISEDTAWNGLTIDISGRNLLGSQYGAAEATAVRLVPVNGGAAITQTIKECNPYRIVFTVSGAAAGAAYYVEVTNDGTNWAPLSSGQILTVVAEGEDPLGLGVAWAGGFNWTSTYIDVTAYGATNNDTTDDTAAIQAAVNAAAAQENGGVVYLPAGNYYISRIAIPAHVVILGESTEGTIVYYNAINHVNMFDSVGDGEAVGWQGFARFTIRLVDNAYQPRTYFNLGHEWLNRTVRDVNARTCEHFFLSEVDIDTDVYADGGSPRGNAIVPIIGAHFLMHDCHFVGYRATIASGLISEYASIRNSYMEISSDVPQCNADYTFLVNADLYVHYETGVASHGWTVRGNSHVEDCYVFGTGGRADCGDGEALLAEATHYYDYGRVVGVDGKAMLLDGVKGTLSGLDWRYGKMTIVIIDGTGIGQYRFVDMEASGFEWNTSTDSWNNIDTTRLVVTEPWDVEPDATSMYSLVLLIDNVTFYENVIDDCSNSIVFYGNVIDGVIANNDSVDSMGIWIFTSHVKNTARVTMAYRNTVRDNDIIGVSRTTDRAGIYIHTQRNGVGGEYVGVFTYSLDIKNNRIYGDPTITPEGNGGSRPPYNGIVIESGYLSSDYGCVSTLGEGDAIGTIIQNNVLMNLRDGIYLTNCTYGTLLADNYYKDVTDQLILFKTPGNDGEFLLLKNIGDATAAPACDDHDCNDWDTTVAPATGTCVWCGTSYTENVLAASIGAHAVTLEDSINLDFFLDLSADVLADQEAYVKVTLPDMNGTIIHVPVGDLTSKVVDGDTLYLLPCSVSAKEMTGIVRLQVFSGDWNSSAIEFTVQDYAAKILADPTTYAKEQDVVKAMLNYGAAAQLHFGYNTGDLANSILAEEDRVYAELDTLDLTSWNALTIEDTAAVDFIGATLMLEGKTGLRLYFNIADPDAYTFTGGSWVDKAGNGYTGYVEVEDIVAKALGDTFTVTVKSGEDVVATVNHSPMKYGYNVQQASYAESLDDLVAALYDYYSDAKAYFAPDESAS